MNAARLVKMLLEDEDYEDYEDDADDENLFGSKEDWKLEYDRERRKHEMEEYKKFVKEFDFKKRRDAVKARFADLQKQYPNIDIDSVGAADAYEGIDPDQKVFLSFDVHPLFEVGGPNDGLQFPSRSAAFIFDKNGISYDPRLGTLDRYATSREEYLAKVLNVFLSGQQPPKAGKNWVGIPLRGSETDTDYIVAVDELVDVDELPKLLPRMERLRQVLVKEFKIMATVLKFRDQSKSG